jgi:orotidine-5'-phosphate decarboxylase
MVDNKALIVALDFDDLDNVLRLTDRLDPSICRLKVGKQLFTRTGPMAVERLVDRGFDVFLDLKFHDIPNTVANAVSAAADLGVWMINVHAVGGSSMMKAAHEALAGRQNKPLLTAVTVLTSMAEADLAEVGFQGPALSRVVELAKLTERAGLDGVVCSAREAVELRKVVDPAFILVTPGIRLKGDSVGDQKRIVEPAAAIAAGADYLVVGRSITTAADPVRVIKRILSSLEPG